MIITNAAVQRLIKNGLTVTLMMSFIMMFMSGFANMHTQEDRYQEQGSDLFKKYGAVLYQQD
jgi:hypothetical protein